nr:MAG TPA: hypothetical protein [Caudoviricetes sp.]
MIFQLILSLTVYIIHQCFCCILFCPLLFYNLQMTHNVQ